MEKIIIKQESAGGRIDRFLAREFFLYSRAEIIKKIKKGEVLINSKEVKPSYILEEGDAVVIENFSREAKDTSLFVNKKLEIDILFENEDIFIINKQAGVQVHPSFGEKENTLVNALLAHYPEIAEVHDGSVGAELRPGIVHRLDKDTTGLVVVAKNKKTFGALKENFKNRTVEKKYLAIAKGIFAEKEGIIEKAIAKSSDHRKQVIARNNTKTVARLAETRFKVIEEIGQYSVVEVSPKTGRTHQIRIHLASIGHPIAGDLIYGLKDSKKIEKEPKRQMLHAQRLKFELFGKPYEFVAPVPQDFKEFLASIRE